MSADQFSYDECEAAMCIWEYSLGAQSQGCDDVFDWLRGGEGAAAARDMCIMLAPDCERTYQIAKLMGFDDCFDWDFVPMWVNLCMEITQDSELTNVWIKYLAYKITERAKERWG